MSPEPQSSTSVRDFALDLQQALRADGGAGSETWRTAVEQGLSQAYAAGDIVALCDVVQAIVSLLDAQGRLRDAVSEIDHALVLARTDANARAMLYSMRATLLAACGDVPGVTQAVTDAQESLRSADIPFAVAKCELNCATARLSLLDPAADEHSLDLHPHGDARTADTLFLMSYLIPFRFAMGAGSESHPLVRTFRIQATSANHEYRLSDARLFEAAEGTIVSPLRMFRFGDPPKWHWLGNWRAAVLRFRQSVLSRDWAGAEESLQALLRARRRSGHAQLDPIGGFEMLFLALRERADDAGDAFRPPEAVHLLSLPSVFAGAEAVALDGSQHAATEWYRWFEANIPAGVTTSLEWPVSRWRIQALLALRAGNERAAKRDCERAIEWATAAKYPVELAAAQLQLSELLRHRGGANRSWRQLREAGSDGLRAVGLDPAVFAYAVARTAPAGGKDGLASKLTPRETEVLAHLADGLTYRAVGDLLGVKWTTVQTLAHRCYEKLDASGRRAAVARARELGIL